MRSHDTDPDHLRCASKQTRFATLHKLSNLLIICFARPPVHGVAGAFRGSDRHCLGPHTICARPISQLLHKHLHRRCTPLRTASFALTIRRERTMVTPPVVIVTCAHLVPLLHLRYGSRMLLAARHHTRPFSSAMSSTKPRFRPLA